MDEIERHYQTFRGGQENIPLTRHDFIGLFTDLFNTLSYQKIKPEIPSYPSDLSFTANRAFWNAALNNELFQSMRILLQGFHLTEWMPSSPGRYFTSEAGLLRKSVDYSFDSHLKEYCPPAKRRMILSGIGSIRLSAKHINSKDIYFLGASSSGISHQGIPIALHESEYHRTMQIIHKHGGCFANIIGTLQVLPRMPYLTYDRGVPKYCLVLEDIEVIRPSLSQELLTTVSIAFANQEYGETDEFQRLWSFCSFCPTSGDDLDTAVDWLKSYAKRYSHDNNPLILSDFDEHYRHFDNPVEFPLSQVSSKDISIDRLREYLERYNFRLNLDELNLGEKNDRDRSSGFSAKQTVTPVNILFCYAHEDETLMEKLNKQLKPLQRQGFINVWYDRDIDAGVEWEQQVMRYLNTAQIILLLISPDFINSDYCYGIEMKRALERHERGETHVIPVILRHVHWQGMPFSRLQALPRNGKPITDQSWYNLDTVLFDVVEDIRRVIEHFSTKSSTNQVTKSSRSINRYSLLGLYHKGDKVRHSEYGEGVVIQSEWKSPAQLITVQFETGIMRINMNFTDLEKLS